MEFYLFKKYFKFIASKSVNCSELFFFVSILNLVKNPVIGQYNSKFGQQELNRHHLTSNNNSTKLQNEKNHLLIGLDVRARSNLLQ